MTFDLFELIVFDIKIIALAAIRTLADIDDDFPVILLGINLGIVFHPF